MTSTRPAGWRTPSPQRETPTRRPTSGKGWIAGLIAIGGFMLALCVAGYAIVSGQGVKSVDPSGKIEFYNNGTEYSQQDIQRQQADIQRQVDEAQQRARQQADGTRDAATVPDLRGRWLGGNGMYYDIQQWGSRLVLSEISPYGITAIGQGEIDGSTVTFGWQAFNNVRGTLRLTLSTNGTRMDGTITSDYFGSAGFVLTR